MKIQTLLSLLLGLMLAVSEVRAAAPVVITHFAEAKKSAVTVRFTEEIRLLLPVPTETAPGYEWQILSNDPRILRLTSSPKLVTAPPKSAEKSAVPDASAAPAGAHWATSFVALRPGRSVVRLAYVRANAEREQTVSEQREITVNVR